MDAAAHLLILRPCGIPPLSCRLALVRQITTVQQRWWILLSWSDYRKANFWSQLPCGELSYGGAQMANHWYLWSKPVGTRGWCSATWVNWEAELLRQANNSRVSDVGSTSFLTGAWSQFSSQPPPWLQPVINLEPTKPGLDSWPQKWWVVTIYCFILLTFWGYFLHSNR